MGLLPYLAYKPHIFYLSNIRIPPVSRKDNNDLLIKKSACNPSQDGKYFLILYHNERSLISNNCAALALLSPVLAKACCINYAMLNF